MEPNVNNNVQNAAAQTLRMFENFANGDKQVSGKTIVRLTGDGPERTITPAKGDFVGNVGRSGATKEANEAARTAFRSAIADMFGGEDKIPQSVKTAMKLGDYGQGRPLTARRIRATFAAIEQQLSETSGLSLKAVSNPAVRDKLANDPGLCARLKGLSAEQRGRIEANITAGIRNPIPDGKFPILNNPGVNEALRKGFQSIFDEAKAGKKNYTPDALLKQAAADIYRGSLTKNGEVMQCSAKNVDKMKSCDDTESFKAVLLKVFDNERDAMDALPMFNQGAFNFMTNGGEDSFGVAMGFGNKLASFGNPHLKEDAARNFDVVSKGDGSYRVSLTFQGSSLLLMTDGEREIALDTSAQGFDLKATFDLVRDRGGNFCVDNMSVEGELDLKLADADNIAWS